MADFLVAQPVKNLPAMWEMPVQSVSQEDPLEKGMATHSSTLACRVPWTEEPGELQSMGLQRVVHDGATHTHTHAGLLEVSRSHNSVLATVCAS